MEKRDNPILLLACTHSFGAKFFQGQLRFMKEKGFDVVVLSAPGDEIEQLCLYEGATFVPFMFRRDISPLEDLKAVFQLRKILKEINPTIINTGTPKAGLLVCMAAKFTRFKLLIFTLRGLRSETLSGFKKLLVKGMETLTCSLAEIVIPISPSLDTHAQKSGILSSKKSLVLGMGSSNGVDVKKFTSSFSCEKKMEVREQLGIDAKDFVISYIGRVNNDKGIPELFHAFKKLAINEPTVKFLIVGKFEEEDAVSAEIRAELETHPQVILKSYREDIKTIYEIIDVLVLYSKREGFGNILIEASSMGVPVIAANIPGCMDAVNHGISGYLVNNQLELFERLKYYFNNRERLKEDGQQGRKWVVKNFDSTIIWNKQLELYNKLMEG